MKIKQILQRWTSEYLTTENCILTAAILGGVLIYSLARRLQDFF